MQGRWGRCANEKLKALGIGWHEDTCPGRADKQVAEFARYIVYVDESGDPGLTGVGPEFPVFALAFCIFDQADYTDRVIPGPVSAQVPILGT